MMYGAGLDLAVLRLTPPWYNYSIRLYWIDGGDNENKLKISEFLLRKEENIHLYYCLSFRTFDYRLNEKKAGFNFHHILPLSYPYTLKILEK